MEAVLDGEGPVMGDGEGLSTGMSLFAASRPCIEAALPRGLAMKPVSPVHHAQAGLLLLRLTR